MSHAPMLFQILADGEADWICRMDQHGRLLCRYPNKATMIDMITAIAQRYRPSHLVVHRRDGSVEHERSFG